jgi:predicted choloylglycine hydrolase
MELRFRALDEDRPGERWAGEFRRSWPAYSEWFLREGDDARPDLATSRRMLVRHMPELVPLWERLVEISGGGEQAARMLSLYRPTPYLTGCSQAVWTRGRPLLVRNYDYHPGACEGTLLRTAWTGTRVLASSDCLWGVLDGVNEHGLCVALSFGGRRVVGEGFGIPLVLRYLLELCRTTAEASEILLRVPSHMAYNVSLLDASGEHAVAILAPDRAPAVLPLAVATNHQHQVEWTRHDELTRSAERERLLAERLADEELGSDAFVEGFLRAPLFATRYDRGFGTLYTAAYDPAARRAEFLWPHHRWAQSLDDFEEGELLVEYVSTG